MSIDVVEVVIWRESSVSGGSGAVQMFLRWQQRKVLFLVLWLKLVKDFLKVRCRLALLPFLISCLIWLDLVASLPLIKERILVIILLLHFLSLMLGSVLVLMLPLLVWLTPDLRI